MKGHEGSHSSSRSVKLLHSENLFQTVELTNRWAMLETCMSHDSAEHQRLQGVSALQARKSSN